MTITESIIFLENAQKRTRKKSQRKHYETFIAMLTDLKSKELDEYQFEIIEKELEKLKLSSKLSFNQLQDNFSKLKQFLKVKFSLTEEGHYTSLGIALGMCFGIALGSVIGKYIGASIGMTFGMLMGVAIGKSMDSKAEINGKSLKTTLQ